MKKNFIILIIFLLAAGFNMKSFADDYEDAAAMYNQAIDLYKQDDVNGAIDLFKKAIELKPDFQEAHYNLAQILMYIDKNEEALKSLEVLLQINPKDTETLYNIGKIQYKRGYLSNAYKHLTAIAENAPQYASAKILIEKIEKRQDELKLQAVISEHKPQNDGKGTMTGVDIVELDAPSGVATDGEGNIYAASFAQNSIYKVSILGKKSVFSNSSLIKGPIGIAVDLNNNVYVANYSANNILRIAPDGNAVIFAQIQKPYYLLFDKNKNRLYVTEHNSNKIVKIDL